MLSSLTRLFSVVGVALNIGLSCASAQIFERPYNGKQIRMVIAGGVGGGSTFMHVCLASIYPVIFPETQRSLIKICPEVLV